MSSSWSTLTVVSKLIAWLTALWQLLDNSGPIATGIVGTIGATAIWAALAWVTRGFRRRFGSKTRSVSRLTYYRERLEADTLRLKHSWMADEQVLSDLLIPVHVAGRSGARSEFANEWPQFLRSRAPALALIGPPGSGKTVALRMAARAAWVVEWNQQDQWREFMHIPVIFTFAELRIREYNVLTAAVESLATRGLSHDLPPSEGRLQCHDYALEWVRDGRAVLILDGLDELSDLDRRRAISALSQFSDEHPKVRIVLSCRSSVYGEHRAQIAHLNVQELELAEFDRPAIRRFVRGWRFGPGKDARDLLAALSSRPHLMELAQNPLMLTIIAFMYTKPGSNMPDNRAGFYSACSKALLEEWDRSQGADRANRFERPHKEELLGRLANAHLRAADAERDISELGAQHRFAEWAPACGIPAGENIAILREIVTNSGLLRRFPPDGLRFPHRTFMEYFSAFHFLSQESQAAGHDWSSTPEILKAYDTDPKLFREVLLLYCGLSRNRIATSQCVRHLLNRGELDMALESIGSAQAVTAEVFDSALKLVDTVIRANPTPRIVECLGLVARHESQPLADQAYSLLIGVLPANLRTDLTSDALQALLLSIARSGRKEGIKVLVEYFDRFDLANVLAAMDEGSLAVAAKLIHSGNVGLVNFNAWLKNLEAAGAVQLIYDAALSIQLPQLSARAWQALGRLSASEEFLALLSDPETPIPPSDARVAQVLRRWGWRSSPGQSLLASSILIRVAIELSEAPSEPDPKGVALETTEPLREFAAADTAVAFLAEALLWDRHFNHAGILDQSARLMWGKPPRLVRLVWRSPLRNSRWSRAMGEDKPAVQSALVGTLGSVALLGLSVLALVLPERLGSLIPPWSAWCIIGSSILAAIAATLLRSDKAIVAPFAPTMTIPSDILFSRAVPHNLRESAAIAIAASPFALSVLTEGFIATALLWTVGASSLIWLNVHAGFTLLLPHDGRLLIQRLRSGVQTT